ncbi:MAG: hypothetical protein FRX48_09626 [Lasallia pustulata]|uniref:Uncharacterized protein n=1 Tax=Lasallia pustulata TaxID=136370 RepID=A0A5M8PBE0_9LECA|nr:MAG: hypothetical protein FRX48_09626 [Lasallia pustulata]
MEKIDAIDHDALRRGSERYMADLRETEKEMQTLGGFWRDCGFITGQRTPSSTTNSSPKESWKKQRSPLSPDEASLDDTSVSEDSTHLSNQSSATTADIAPPNIDATTSQSSPVITSGKSLQPLESQPKKLRLQSQKAGADVESVLRKSLWNHQKMPQENAEEPVATMYEGLERQVKQQPASTVDPVHPRL